MSRRPVIYDISRLATRFSRPTPNGIDRVDLAYAKHFLASERGAQGALLGPMGPRAVENKAARRIVDALEGHWGEQSEARRDVEWSQVQSLLGSKRSKTDAAGTPGQITIAKSYKHRLRALRRGVAADARAILSSRSIARVAPERAVYVNTSQFPLWIDGYFRWLDRRRDVKLVLFLHDLLPLRYPEFFPPAEEARHAKRIEVLARRAAGVIVATPFVREALVEHLQRQGLPSPPVLANSLSVSEAFQRPANRFASASSASPYFVAVGTLEPRKNHLFLLQVWRELAEELGDLTPKLVLVGARGWDNENVLDMLERCERLRPFVIEVSGLSTPAIVDVMRSASAVLMPSLAEGFGLPVVEALATGTTVFASDIPPFRMLEHARVTRLDPIDGPGWRRAVLARLEQCRSPIPQENRCTPASPSSVWCIDQVEEFVAGL